MAPYLWQSARTRAAAMQANDEEKAMDPNSVQSDSASEKAAQLHRNANCIQRVSLRLLMPSWRDVLRRLFKQCEIVEPTYKDIISVYRRASAAADAAPASAASLRMLRRRSRAVLLHSSRQSRRASASAHACRKVVEKPSDKVLKADPSAAERFRRDQRGIVVKRFEELPVADLEIIFPDKTVGLKLIDKLTLYGTAVGAIVGACAAFFGANVELNYVLSTLGVLGGKLFQVRAHASTLCGRMHACRH
jgi:Protein of unknown function (DUF3754)